MPHVVLFKYVFSLQRHRTKHSIFDAMKKENVMSIIAEYKGVTFTDDDVVKSEDYIPKGSSNPYNVRPFLMHDHGFVVAVVFADCLQDALDEAADKGKLDRYSVSSEDLDEYPNGEDDEHISSLGNAGELFDIESLEVIELPNPKFSFVALFNANK